MKRFDQLVGAVIVANTAVLGWQLVDHRHEFAFEVVHHVILAVFFLELVTRLAVGNWGKWETFDAAVIGLSFLPILGGGLLVLRVARLARLLHLGRHASNLRLIRVPALVREGPA